MTIRPHAWRYRDYVVRSFNEDKPYDQFKENRSQEMKLTEVIPSTSLPGFLRMVLGSTR